MGTVKYSGPVASFHCPSEATIRSLKVHFSPKQEGSGDPSPENVRPIVGWDGVEVYRNDSTTNYEFGVLGKNKFNWNVPVSESSPTASVATTAREFTLDTYVIGMSVNNYYRQNYANWVLNPSVENGVVSFSSGGASGYGIAFPLKLAAGQTYFLSGTGNGVAGATYFNENGELISYQNDRLNKTITVPENATTTLIGFYANTSNTDFTFSDIQLELGSTATAYEPYDPNKTVYGGWVDLVSGEAQEEWTKINIPTTQILGGQLNGYNRDISTERYFQISSSSLGTHQALLSNKAISANCRNDNEQFRIGPDGTGLIHYALPNSTLGIATSDTAEDRNSKIIAWLAENPIEIVYNLKTPITYNLPPHSTALKTFLSTNNVWSNADYVEVEYDLHETQSILARKQFIIANQPHVVKPAAAPLQSFVTDMAAPLKNCKVYFSPVQEGEGDPSPENVRAISGWTGMEVYTAGENLIPVDYEAVEGKWKPTEGAISGSVYNMGQFPVPPALIQYQSETKGITYFGFMDGPIQSGEPVYDVITMSNRSAYPFDNTGGHQYALITSNRETVDSYKVIISVGHTYKEYSEPSGTTIPITFPSEAGTVYGGYVDLVTGEVWETWRLITGNDLTSITAPTSTSSPWNHIFTIGLWNNTTGTWDKAKGASNIISDVAITGSSNINQSIFGVSNSAGMYLRDDSISTREEFLEKYGNKHIAYETAIPILVTTLTPIALKTLRGTNNIWSNANGNIELSYWKH